jgi:hypothetical protein
MTVFVLLMAGMVVVFVLIPMFVPPWMERIEQREKRARANRAATHCKHDVAKHKKCRPCAEEFAKECEVEKREPNGVGAAIDDANARGLGRYVYRNRKNEMIKHCDQCYADEYYCMANFCPPRPNCACPNCYEQGMDRLRKVEEQRFPIISQTQLDDIADVGELVWRGKRAVLIHEDMKFEEIWRAIDKHFSAVGTGSVIQSQEWTNEYGNRIRREITMVFYEKGQM